MTDRNRRWGETSFTVAIAGASLGVYAAWLSDLAPFDPNVSLEWWTLAALFVLAQAAVVHLALPGRTVTFTMVEIPIVLGLFLALPGDLVLAIAAGGAIALAIDRASGLSEASFEIARSMLGTVVAVTVFRLVAHPGDVGAVTWLAAYLAAGAMTFVRAATVSARGAIADGKWRLDQVRGDSVLELVPTLLNTSVGLIGVLLLETAPFAIVFLIVPCAIVLVAYRSLAARQREDRGVRFLYGCMHVIDVAPDIESMLFSLVSRIGASFRAEVAEIVLYPNGSSPGVRYVSRAGAATSEATDDAGERRIGALGAPILLPGPDADDELRLWMSDRGIREAVSVPITGNDQHVGYILAGNRVSRREHFDSRDLEVLRNLGRHVGLVTERAQMDGRLRTSMRHATLLASIVQSSRDAIVSVTPDGTIATWNPGAEALFGVPEHEAVGRSASILSPSDPGSFPAGLADVLEGHRLQSEAEYLRGDGSRVPVSLRVSPIHDGSGWVVGVSAIFRDERERRRREAELGRSEQRLRGVFEDAPVGMVLCGPDGTISRTNAALCRLAGRSQDELRGLPLDDLLRPVEPNRSGDGPAGQALEDPGGIVDATLVASTGRTVLVHSTTSTIPGVDGGDPSELTTIEDVTERADAGLRLRETEARFRRVVLALSGLRDRATVPNAVAEAARELTNADYAVVGIVTEDGRGIEGLVISGVDSAAEEWVRREGSPEVDAFERWIVEATAQGRVMDGPQLSARLSSIGVPVRPEETSLLGIPIAHDDQSVGYLVLASVHGRIFDDRDEEVATALASQAVVAIENARVHAQNVELVKRLRGVSARLRRANAVKSDFLASLSHELKTPLSTIMLASDMLQDPASPLPRARARDWGAKIHTNARHLLGLVEDLIDLSRIEAGRLDLDVRSIEVDPLIHDTIGALSPLSDERRITVDVPSPTRQVILADPLRTRQVLLNLLSNAIKFTPEGGRVWVEVTTERGEVTVAVHDSGIGIARRDVRRIFEPFERAAKSSAPGAGLGLTISLNIMRLLDGRLEVSSTPGEGSTFKAVFRCAGRRRKASPRARARSDGAETGARATGRTRRAIPVSASTVEERP